jgi:hypothetical protein
MHYTQEGPTYKGEWCRNRRDGEGVFTTTEQERYSGFWKEGMRTGMGSQIYRNTDRYEGSWEANRSGQMMWASYTMFHADNKYRSFSCMTKIVIVIEGGKQAGISMYSL